MFTTATPAREPDGTVTQPSGLLVLFMGRTVTHLCCNLLLQTLECYRTCSHAHFACFPSRRTNTSSVLHALRAYVFSTCTRLMLRVIFVGFSQQCKRCFSTKRKIYIYYLYNRPLPTSTGLQELIPNELFF